MSDWIYTIGPDSVEHEIECHHLGAGKACGKCVRLHLLNRRPTSERDRLRDAVVEAGKNVDANDGMDEEWKLRYALRALAAFESSQKEG